MFLFLLLISPLSQLCLQLSQSHYALTRPATYHTSRHHSLTTSDMARFHAKHLLPLLVAAVLVVLTLASVQASANLATFKFLQLWRDKYPPIREMWHENVSSDYCTWEGVSCDEDGYVSVNVSGKDLVGWFAYIPLSTRNLGTEMLVKSFDASNNPGLIGDLDNYWYLLRHLKFINVSNTGVGNHNPLPWQWTYMPLEELRAANTRICGNLPDWNIPTLRVVDLSGCKLQGTLHPSWSSMVNLEHVDLSNNNFCGCAPSGWSDVPALKAALQDMSPKLLGADCEANTCSRYLGCTLDKPHGEPAYSPLFLLVTTLATLAVIGSLVL